MGRAGSDLPLPCRLGKIRTTVGSGRGGRESGQVGSNGGEIWVGAVGIRAVALVPLRSRESGRDGDGGREGDAGVARFAPVSYMDGRSPSVRKVIRRA
jgi:hypothetical protein